MPIGKHNKNKVLIGKWEMSALPILVLVFIFKQGDLSTQLLWKAS